jgi:preprotein translocase subunit SecB
MANEQQDAPQGGGEQTGEKKLVIQKIYIKDLSFEAPESPGSFTVQWEPQIELDLNTAGQGVGDDIYEVVLTITVTAKNNDKNVYVAEVQQAGLFNITGFDREQLKEMLGSFCPSILFPYAREAISDVVTRGGFPQMLLAPVNFDALYAQHLEQQQQQAPAS